MSEPITLTGRLSYPTLWTPKAFKSDDPTSPKKFSAAIVFDVNPSEAILEANGFKGSARIAQFIMQGMKQSVEKIKEAVAATVAEKWSGKTPKLTKGGLRDGSEKDNAGYGDGTLFITAYEKNRPNVIDRDKTPLVEEDGVVYGGCYVNMVVTPWAQDNSFGKGVNFNLLLVQFVADGDPFASGARADVDALPDLSDDAESDASSMLD